MIKIEYPIIQLNETNFQFLKRIFAKKKIPLLIDDLSEGKQSIWIGSKTNPTQKKIIAKNYRLKKSSLKQTYHLYLSNSYELQTEDFINLENEKLRIIESKVIYKKAIFYTEFILVPQKDKSYLTRYKEENFQDLLTGKNFVCEVVNNKDKDNKGRLQLKFNIENDTESVDNYWFNYVTPYSSNDTGFFFTPEIGDKILVYFQTEENPIGLTTIRSNTNEKYFSNPNEKYFKNNFAREIHLGEKEINIVFKENENFIKMDEDKIIIKNNNTHFILERDKIIFGNSKASFTLNDNIEIVSTGKINVKAENDLEITANTVKIKGKANVAIDGSSGVSIKGSSINLN